MDKSSNAGLWPELKFDELEGTISTVQLWTQIAGKIRLKKMPWINHSWHVTLYISARGLTTGSIPYDKGIFQIDFDFIAHELIISTSSGETEKLPLRAMSTADFYQAILAALTKLNIEVSIYARPNEIEPATPFAEDHQHRTYDKNQMHKLWQAWVQINNVFTRFRSGFCGKCSPVHLFWGAFDLAVTRFSGRTAPLHPGGAPNIPIRVMQEAYSHEVSSCGFWPGNASYPHPVFYAYCYPTPPAFSQQKVEPEAAFYSEEMGEFLLPYEIIRKSSAPENVLMQFLQSTYEAAANTGNWDKEACAFNFFEKNSTE